MPNMKECPNEKFVEWAYGYRNYWERESALNNNVRMKRGLSILMLSSMLMGSVIPSATAAEEVIFIPSSESTASSNKVDTANEAVSGDSASENEVSQEGKLLIEHTPSSSVDPKADYVVNAMITGGIGELTASVLYSVDGQSEESVILTQTSGNTYTAVIPQDKLKGSELKYHIEVSGGSRSLLLSPTYTVGIKNTIQMLAQEVKVPQLLITQLVPDTKNVPELEADGTPVPNKSVDGYESIEVYNNSAQEIDMDNYDLFYINGGTETKWTLNPGTSVKIPSRQAAVFWVQNSSNKGFTDEHFNNNYKTESFNPSLVEGTNLFRIQGGNGMANTGTRALAIRTKQGTEVVKASYTITESKANYGIRYNYPVDGSTTMIIEPQPESLPATPGQLLASQIPAEPTGPSEPGSGTVQITHTPVQQAEGLKDLPISALIERQGSSSGSNLTAELLYKSPSQSRYTVISMPLKGGNEYTAVIPGVMLAESRLDYKVRVGSAEQTYSVAVNLPKFDPDKAPALLVTKVVPNTANVSGTSSDAFEYIEVYNNTDQPVDFDNYKIYYRYPDSGIAADVKWPSSKESFIIPAGKSVVFWIKNGANSSYTTDDFNTFYKSTLVQDSNLFVIDSAGMANSGRRAIVIKTNTEKEISAAYYDADSVYEKGTKGDETKEDTALLYKYPVSGTTMIKMSSGLVKAVPGAVDPQAVPEVPVHVEPDTVAPTLNNLTGTSTIDQSKSIDLKVDAKDDKQLTSVKIYVKSDKQQDYVQHNLSEDYGDSLYHYKLSSADLIGRKKIEYYFTASDGTNFVKTDVATLAITGGPSQEALRLNFKDGEIINGSRTLKGTAQNADPDTLKLSIDGKQLTKDTYAALEHDAYFVFDAKNVDYYFKNAVTMGEPIKGEEEKTILYTFLDPIPTYTTLSFPIDAGRLQLGTDNVIYIRAGSKSSPFDPRVEENKDDFEIRNVRLLLADGTEIWDPAYNVPDKELKMGDSAGKFESIGFRFNLTSSLLKSQAYSWNTKESTDGEHVVQVESQGNTVTSKVTVDNTAPTIQPSVEEGKEYRGTITLSAEIKDSYAGVDQIEVKLDGQSIKLPYTTTSGKMSAGNHVLMIKAVDKIGNIAEKKVTFTVPNENPFAPKLIAPEQGMTSVGNNATLTVKVEDPSNDSMNVSFYKGFKYDGNRTEGFTGYKNASVTEPPKEMVPAGEQALTADEYASISKLDGKYLVNDSVEKFPYQRFEIKLDPTVKPTDRVDISWKGKSLEGRKVSLYAWSKASGRWEQLDHVIAGTEDFQLQSTVQAGDYADGKTIQVMVQDEIAPSAAPVKSGPITNDPYDFSFVWMSDTQYYSQSFPQIYQKIVGWVADNKDKINLKYVIHTGDIVDKSYQDYQWQEADKDMKVLEDAGISYGVLAGNHDVGHQDNDYTKYWEYFGESRFKKMPTFAGSYENNRGHYDLVSAGGNDFIIVYMGWGLGDKEIDWMNEVVAKYPERKAILCLHEYMLVSNNRAPIADKIYEKVVKPNKNVFATLSGHYHDSQLKVDEIDDNGDKIPDRKVYQMLADYQGAPEGGLGYIRLMQFDMKNNKLHIKTYSPYLDKYNYYDPVEDPKYLGKDEFSLDLDLQPTTKRVATDYFGVKVYTDQRIGSNQKVQSGTQTSVKWNALNSKGYYQWYVKAEDENSGSTVSDIWGFYSGQEAGTGGGQPNQPGGSTSGGMKPTPEQPGKPSDSPTIIEAALDQNRTYNVSSDVLEKAINTAAADSKIMIKLKGDATKLENSRLILDAASVQKAKERKLILEVVSPTTVVTLPAQSLPANLSHVDKLTLTIDTTLNPTIQANLQRASGSRGELSSKGLVFTLRMTTLKGQIETTIHQFGGPVTVKRILNDEQKKQLDPEYAGVYYLNDGKAEYIGGHFEGNTVSFSTGHFSEFAVMEYRKHFEDLTGGWADDYIQKLAAKHVITGMDDTHYKPALDVSRADFAVLAIRSLKMDPSKEASAFADVTPSAYYSGYVSKSAELGLFQGSGGKFRPTDKITREEAAVVLVKMAEQMKKSSSASSTVEAFADKKQISSWASQAVDQARELGLIHGKGSNRFDPKGNVTRAEIAKMLYGLLK